MQEDLVSIVVPAYQAARFLAATLRTVECQTHVNWELLLTEDASNDSTEDLVADFSQRNPTHRVIYTRHDVNSGPSASRNTAIAHARGAFVALLDADDLWLPDHLAVSIKALCNTNADVVYSTALMFDDQTGGLLGLWGPNATECAEFPKGLYHRSFIVPSTTVLKSSTFKRVGLFDTDPSIQGCEDVDFWLRCVKAGIVFRHLTGLHCMYRKGHAEAATTTLGRLLPRQLKVLERHSGMSEIPASIQRDALVRFRLSAGMAQWRHNRLSAARVIFGAWRLKPVGLPVFAFRTLAAVCIRPGGLESLLGQLRR